MGGQAKKCRECRELNPGLEMGKSHGRACLLFIRCNCWPMNNGLGYCWLPGSCLFKVCALCNSISTNITTPFAKFSTFGQNTTQTQTQASAT